MRSMRKVSDIEGLENRRLFSAGVALVNGTLTITATAGDDQIIVAPNAAKHTMNVRFNGTWTAYKQASVTEVSAMLGAGNDSFDASTCAIPVHVDGEAGNDTILGGSGNDCLIGGLDNDSIAGNLGCDSISGSGGKDTLDGGPGSDRIDGGKSNDILHGGSSNDRLIGGDGNDQLYGEGGDDAFYTDGVYVDYLYGGSGRDMSHCDGSDVLASIEVSVIG
jgi:Ca2+-binding RTX toxin-like protein